MQKFVHDLLTNQTSVEDMSEEEIALHDKLNIEFQENLSQASSKQSAKQSALAKLSALGLTEDETKAILGL